MTSFIDPSARVEEPCEIGGGSKIMERAKIGKHSTIGAGAVVGPGVSVGRYARVGDGSAVKADVPDHAYVAGDPAIQYGYVCKCGTRLGFFYSLGVCVSCDRRYQHRNNVVYCTSEEDQT